MWKYTSQKQCNEFLLSLQLINSKDSKKYIRTLYSISNKIEDNYKIYHLKKHSGKIRTIYEPNEPLKHIQRQILNNILNHRTISKYAKAYHKNLSLFDNASPHINKKIILKLDIKNFFDNITFLNIYNTCFPIEYFPKSVGMLLTHLCTYNDYLPQGAPTSAYISNLVMKDFDEALGAWCEEQDITYTRYSDDMTFSGDFIPSLIIPRVKKLLLPLNLELNNQKIHVITHSRCQTVTGLVVNHKVNTHIAYRKTIRQELYYISKFGLNSHLEHTNNQLSKETYLNNLYGRILFVLQIDEYNQEFLKYREIIHKLQKQLSLIN